MYRLKLVTIFGISIILFCLLYGYYVIKSVPIDFPQNSRFTIAENESIRSVSVRLEKEHYITSALWFRVWVSFLGKDRSMQLGNYEFDSRYTLGGVVKKLLLENPAKPLIQVTIPEGSTSYEVASIIHTTMPTISVDIFGEKVSEYKADGKLFPSTYFLLPSHKEGDIIKMMTETFEKKYASFFRWTVIPEPLTSVNDVISMAAILEGEAKTEEDMKVVAGILIARLKKGMPLQVDAARETYASKGLPKVSINNPGLIAIDAVFNSIPSPYLFYITGKDGAMYYAKTFDEHKRNIQKYLR